MKDDEGEVMIGNINEEIRNFLYPILCFIFHKADIRSTPHKKIHETFFFFESCMVVWWWWWKKQWIELKILYVKMMMVEIVWRKILKSRHKVQVSCVVKKELKRSSSIRIRIWCNTAIKSHDYMQSVRFIWNVSLRLFGSGKQTLLKNKHLEIFN
jgi:hypothetical protein